MHVSSRNQASAVISALEALACLRMCLRSLFAAAAQCNCLLAAIINQKDGMVQRGEMHPKKLLSVSVGQHIVC